MNVLEREIEQRAAQAGRPARLARRLVGCWRSPAGQPRWARPMLLAVAAIAAAAYAWGAADARLEVFYGAAARSMSGSWHDFIFGAFDPAGTVSVDKLPGALWLQAISLRIFGFHVWALVLPQVIEGVLTILVLYRAVARLAGPVAGIAAAITLAVSPVTVALNRGNVSDSLLILLTVVAADATSAALVAGRLRSLLAAAVWVGLAFQAKMMQAWLILPALALAYLTGAPPQLRVRIKHLVLAGALTVVVSLSWMSVVSLVPAHERPYVDGSRDDSLFSQVFSYNGISRLAHGNPLSDDVKPAAFIEALARSGDTLNSQSLSVKPSWHRLLGGLFGRDDGWLLPAALISAIALLVERRGSDRRDKRRALVLLWGTWLLVLGVLFSEGRYLNSYYVAALSPAIAALCGAGAELFWRRRADARVRGALALVLLASAGYGTYLLSAATAVPPWLVALSIGCGVCGAWGTLLSERLRERGRSVRATLALACVLPLPLFTSLLTVSRELGPFEAPFQPRVGSAQSFALAAMKAQRSLRLLSEGSRSPIVAATDSSLVAAPLIYYTGREVLPIGGYLGGVPAPSLSQLRRYIAAKELRTFLIPVYPPSHDPRIVWLENHCTAVNPTPRYSYVQLGLYDCRSARG